MKKLNPVPVDGKSLNLIRLLSIANGAPVVMPKSVKGRIDASRKMVVNCARDHKAVYGINTGFGYFAHKKISKHELLDLQSNLLRSHASGFGDPLPIPETRIAMSLRLNVLVKGFTGVRYELCNALLNLIQNEIYPVIPEYGSVGASGDLAPLAHLALPLIGEGMVLFKGKTIPAADALKKSGLSPIVLKEKEGLSLVNGTQIMLAVGGLALAKSHSILDLADRACALSYEGLLGNVDSLNPLIHRIREQGGQIKSAENILKQLDGSHLVDPKIKKEKVQDPYSLRCAPQIHGPSRDAINYASHIVETEMNGVTDNPLVFVDHHKILSGGNFHGQSLALAFDFASMAMAEIGNVSERRLELLLNPNMSGLPAFLIDDGGYQSGYMAAQYLSASLVNENKLLANPSCTDSIPGNVGVEDHVSMGMTSARKFKKIVENVITILCIELVAAAQAIDLRKIKQLGKGTKKIYDRIRSYVPKLEKDRIISYDIQKIVKNYERL